LDATQAFAALATEWFDAVAAAIDERGVELGGVDDEKTDTAKAILKQGNARLDRLAVLVGPTHLLVKTGAKTLGDLSNALSALPESLADVDRDINLDDD